MQVAVEGEPMLAGVLLAAGLSRRFGVSNKLLSLIEGEPMVKRVALALLGGGLKRVVVVLGHDASKVREALAGTDVEYSLNEHYNEGMGGSVATGAAYALEHLAEAVGLMVCPGDLPWLDPQDVARIGRVFLQRGADRVVAPMTAGRRGHPVCFPRRLFRKLAALDGEGGAKRLIENEGDVVYESSVSLGCIRDIDTNEPMDSRL